MDEVDKAQAHAEEANTLALDEWRRRRGDSRIAQSLSECEECGDEIPEKRRQAVRGCRLCIDCQRAVEAALKRGGHCA